MADTKFSQFTVTTDSEGLQLVGLQGGENVRITWAALMAAMPYIPLSGTEVGSPVTGDVRNLSAFTAYSADSDAEAKVFTEDGNPIVRVGRDGLFTDILNGGISFYGGVVPGTVELVKSNTGGLTVGMGNLSKGIEGNYVFPNKDSLTYAQMQDIADLWGVISKEYADDAAAAVGGIAVGAMYHTAGVVKIRLA